jgi:hypothetical protein
MGEEDASRGEQGGVVRAEVSGWWGEQPHRDCYALGMEEEVDWGSD